ncbi:carotenoid biosynthesis protein [Candidatus Thorarchaeota archaeon]|nr:MAG: carotenoid biosynthesis protein [Candidatus Thorarchaeota archaeon]
MSRVFGLAATSLFAGLSVGSSYLLGIRFEWAVAIQVFVTLVIAAVGEHRVSGEGYYQYKELNGVFLGNVPVWIPFMWVFVCQTCLIISLVVGFQSLAAAICAGITGLVIDLIVIEPILSRGPYALWHWSPVTDGYFSFLPSHLNRFAAPFGNYIVWFFFPFLMSLLLGFLNTLRTFAL